MKKFATTFFVFLMSITLGWAQKGFVINEVDYDNQGTDNAEFVELYNGSDMDIPLANYQVVFVNGSDSLPYTSINLGSAKTLLKNQYLVIASGTVSVPSSALKISFSKSSDNIQNGAPDGIALVDTAQKKMIDALSYEGSITHATFIGFTDTFNLVEGNATSALDNNVVTGSLIRFPDGQDTDDAKTDWVFSFTPSPGTANTEMALDLFTTSANQTDEAYFYPNPSQQGRFYIKKAAEILEITDACGLVITNSGIRNGTLDLSAQGKGMYLVKMQSEEKIWQQKLVVQ